METKYLTIISNRKKIVLNVGTIFYVVMVGKNAEIHTSMGMIYETRMSLGEIEKSLGDGFIKIHRGCLVSAIAIHDITDRINLCNGENLEYALRKKKEIIEQLHLKQKRIINSFSVEGIPVTEEEYKMYYGSFDNLPFAFTDIELVFNEERHAVDWIFRYGNPALAKIEKLSLDQLIGSSFGSLFRNMDSKWLKVYERAALYGEVLEMMDYSPEIDTYLKVICFPTFIGHCGCILFDISEIDFVFNGKESVISLMKYFGGLPLDE